MAEQYTSKHSGQTIDNGIDRALLSAIVYKGVYDATADKFYTDNTKTAELPKDEKALYIDLTTALSYQWNGTNYIQFGGGNVAWNDISNKPFESLGTGLKKDSNNKLTYDPDTLSTVDYVDGSITNALVYVDQQDQNEHDGRVVGDNLRYTKTESDARYVQKGLNNIELNQLANQGSENFGKMIIVGNTGNVVLGDAIPSYSDLSSQLTGNTYNKANLNFAHAKMVMQNGIVFYDISASLKTDITDKQSARRKVMELPPLSGSYTYPDKIDIRITQAECNPTCQENIAEWWQSGGSKYIPLSTFQNKRFSMLNCMALETPTLRTYADSARTQEIYVGYQEAHNGVWNWNGVSPLLVREDDATKIKNLIPGTQYTAYLPYLTQDSATHGGYEKITEFWDQNGTKHTPTSSHQFWKLRKVTFTIDANYLQKAYYASQNCPTDSTGKWGHFQIQQDTDSQLLEIVDQASTAPISYNGGWGTANFIQDHQTAGDVLTQGQIVSNVLYVPGIYTVDGISSRGIL